MQQKCRKTLQRRLPKNPEDSVVITKEELAKERELNRKIDSEFAISEFNVQVNSAIERAYKKGSKETAEKIWNRAYQVALNTRGDITSQTIKELAKRDEVEIKE